MKRLPVARIIYNNYDLWETYPDEDIKEMLIENGCEEDDITDEMIWRERYDLSSLDWEASKYELEQFFLNNGNKWMIFGEVGRWDGTYKAGTMFDTFEDFFYKAAKDCDYWKFYDENGHLYLTCSHHDGTCHYEIKEVTDKGVEYLENWEYGSYSDKRTEEYVHTQIFNRYSRLPRFSEKVYGCKRFEYQPVTKRALIDKLNNQAKSFYC
jgi:hypothetical protein